MSTALPGSTSVPGAGLCRMTRPMFSQVGSSTYPRRPTTSPTACSALVASAVLSPRSSGTAVPAGSTNEPSPRETAV